MTALGSVDEDHRDSLGLYIDLGLTIKRLSEVVSGDSQDFLAAIRPNLLRDVGSIIQMIEQVGERYMFPPEANIDDICCDLTDAVRGSKLDEPTKRAAADLLDAINRYLDSVVNPQAWVHSHPVILAINIAYAESALDNVTSGVWNLLADAEENARIARAAAEARKAGGKARGDRLRKDAEEWKAEALPISQKLDRQHPDWSRAKLATEVLGRLTSEKMPNSVRTVENWLKHEVEAKGLLGNRLRPK